MCAALQLDCHNASWWWSVHPAVLRFSLLFVLVVFKDFYTVCVFIDSCNNLLDLLELQLGNVKIRYFYKYLKVRRVGYTPLLLSEIHRLMFLEILKRHLGGFVTLSNTEQELTDACICGTVGNIVEDWEEMRSDQPYQS